MSKRAPSWFAVALLTAAAAVVAACEVPVSQNLPATNGPPQPPPNQRDAAAADAGVPASGADATVEASATSPYHGNPLCNASPALGDCYPDDPITPMTATACNVDGGASDSGSALACHVESTADGVHAACLSAGTGTNGNPCTSPTDCAAGFECAGKGRCRPYCCAGESRCTADAARDAGGMGEFCDIQPVAGLPDLKVPVCMPVRSCDLANQVAQASEHTNCFAGETCAVVDDGVTSCVEVGPAMVGESCDTRHCAAGLACLGTPGQRQCYTLCFTEASTLPAAAPCVPPQACQGGLPLFTDPSIGICQ